MNKNPFYSIYLRGLLLLVLSFVLCGKAMAYDVSGNVNASSLPDNAEVVLKGNTNLYMDVNKTIKSIRADYPLNINGENILTVSNSNGIAIKSNGDIKITGGTINVVTSSGLGIKSYNGKVFLSGDITVNSNGAAIQARKDVTIDGTAKFINNIKELCINSTIGSVTITGDIIAEGSIHGYNDVKINGGTIMVDCKEKAAIKSQMGSVSLEGDITVNSNGAAIQARKDVTINGTAKLKNNNKELCIYSVNGSVTITGDLIAEGSIHGYYNVKIHGGTIMVDCKKKAAIKSQMGSTSLVGDITVNSVDAAVNAQKEITINGTATIKSKNVAICINSIIGNVTITGDLIAEGSIHAYHSVDINGGTIKVKVDKKDVSSAIRGMNGKVTLSGDVEIESKNSGIISRDLVTIYGPTKIFCHDGNCIKSFNISVKNRLMMASFNASAVAFLNNITFDGLEILYPEGGRVVKGNGGKTIETAVYGKIVDSKGYPSEQVLIGKKPIPSTFNYTGLAVPGVDLGFTLSEELASAVIHCQWQESSDGTTWTDIVGATDNVYVPTESQINNYVRVKIDAEGYDGFITGRACYVKKNNNTEKVVQMTLGSDGDQVYVAYAVPSQEYFILSYKKDVANLTASDWANAVSPSSSGKLVMGGTKGCTNYVYTRKKETISTLPGNSVVCEQIYLGDETKVLQGLKLDVALMEMDGKSPYFTALDKEDNAYYVKYGNVLRIRVSPLPSTATFYGVAANRWITKIVNGYPCGGFFANYQCTQELEEGQNYKEVYYKAWKQINYNEVRAEVTSGGPNSLFTDAFYLHVANESGEIIMDSYQTENVTIGRGEKRTGIQVNTRPLKATLFNAHALVSSISSEGKEPKVTFDNETRTMSVDATEADLGTYYYNVSQCGNTMSNKIRVDVTAPAVEAISLIPDAVSLDRGESITMALQLAPTDSEAKSVTWEVMNTDLASISDDGVLTVKADAPRGNSCVVRVTVDAKYQKECTLTVPKLVPDLSFGETSFEMNVGDPFTAPTLVNPDGLSVTYSSSDENVATVNASTGAVTIQGYGNVFIIASYAGDSDYEAGSASYGIVINRLPCDLAYSVTTASANVGETFTGPMLTNPHSLTVTYTSDDPSVAIIDENTGKVTPLDEGITTITAWFDGDETCEPGDVSYDLTVYAKGDVNRDGKVDQTDVDLTAQHILGKKPDGFYEDAADMNGDKKINAADIVLINKEIKP